MCRSSLLFLIFLSIFVLPANASGFPKYEIRGVWLTTIYGLDWPGRPAQTEEGELNQRQELCRILDQLKEANFNTVFLQVRLRGDVLYRSVIEPASSILTGKYGVLPSYDPLAFAIEECHKRGLDCHAWFVTFPLGTNKAVKARGARSVVKKHPELCKLHQGEWYLDPGNPGTITYLQSLVKEVVSAYDIDGIHFDYIRYPDKARQYPDKAEHRKWGNGKELHEWRRDNINRLVSVLYDTVKEMKPWVLVSSSPLGKYDHIAKMPNAGWTAFSSVHQDPKHWMSTGKHDMIVPMMYYQDNHFYPFVDNWLENANGRWVIPGLGAYRLEEKEGNWNLEDISTQIDYLRSSGAMGSTFFRTAQIIHNKKGILDKLILDYYTYPAMLPPMTWLSDSVPTAPEEIRIERFDDELHISWDELSNPEKYRYTIYYSFNGSPNWKDPRNILATNVKGNRLYLPVNPGAEAGITFCITVSDRFRQESLPSVETFYYLTDHVK